jgi:DNA-binding NtrC family response regulator
MQADTLLVIDDDPVIGAIVERIASDCGYEVEITETARDFRSSYDATPPSTIILDVVIPDTDGLELIGELAAKGSKAKLIIISGYGGRYLQLASDFARFNGLDVVDSLPKPLDNAALSKLLHELRARQGISESVFAVV